MTTEVERLIAQQRARLDGPERFVVGQVQQAMAETFGSLEIDLRVVLAAIEEARNAGTPVDHAWLQQEPRYRRFRTRLLDIRRRFVDRALLAIVAGQRVFSRQAYYDVTRLFAALSIDPTTVPPPLSVIRGRSAQTPEDLLRQLLDGLAEVACKAVEGQLPVIGDVADYRPRASRPRLLQILDDPATDARTRTLIRTETMRSYEMATRERHMAAGDVLQGVQWIAALSPRTCLACLHRHGSIYPVGYVMESHPNCFVAGTVVNGPLAEAATMRWYEGEVVHIRTASGDDLTVTPNHPVLTDHGWVAAGLLREGDHVVRYSKPEGEHAAINPDYERHPAFIDQVAESLSRTTGMTSRRVPGTAEDFHGDGSDREIQVVDMHSLLSDRFDATITEPALQQEFVGTDAGLPGLAGPSPSLLLVDRLDATSSSDVGGSRESSPFFGGGLRHTCGHGGAAVADDYPRLAKPTLNSDVIGSEAVADSLSRLARFVALHDLVDRQVQPSRGVQATILQGRHDPAGLDPEGSADLAHRLTGKTALDNIISVNRAWHRGHVYNLQTEGHWYIANNIIVHNCRCSLAPLAINTPPEVPETGEAWFARQPAAFQQQRLGAAYGAYRDGRVTLGDFTGVREHPIWGRSVQQRSATAVLQGVR